MTPSIRTIWDLTPDLSIHIETVHQLSNSAAVITHNGHGASQEGFDAEWRAIDVLMVEDNRIIRCEVFDEVDLDAALARFDELNRPATKLANAASQVTERFLEHFAARDWHAIADQLAVVYYYDDRRRTVNSGIRRGRDSAMEDIRLAVDLGLWANLSSAAIATRGERLVLSRFRALGHDPEAVEHVFLQLTEIDSDDQFAAVVVFDPEDIDAAFEELDARYLAGEAAAHANTWSVVAESYVGFNRRELRTTKPGWVNIDRRRGAAFAAGDMAAYIQAAWDDSPDINVHVAAVHRLSDLGAVVTYVAHGTSREGFDAEWRGIHVLTVEGDTLSRSELFEEVDLDAALARFDELSRSAPRLENAASQVVERFVACFATRDWAAMSETLAEDMCNDDRRRVVGSGMLHGRDIDIAHMRAAADVGATTITSTVIATRGERLELSRSRISGEDEGAEAFHTELLGIAEIDADERIVARVGFDPDDLDAAFAELDARYTAGEAAAHAKTWSVVAESYVGFNRRELLSTTPGWVSIDHRRGAAFAPGDMIAYIQAAWDDSPDTKIYVEVVHRLSDLGAVVTHVAHGTSREGFDAEWRDINVLTVDGDTPSRSELFNEADRDAALARFDELSTTAPRLENAASQVDERFQAYFAARDWAAMGELLTDDISADDRRRVVNAGIRHGRDAKIADMRATADLGTKYGTSTVIAIRGQRLALVRIRLSGRDQRPDAFHTEMLGIVEINADNQMSARVLFDPDDRDAAFAELDARYLAGEAAAHAHTWALIAEAVAGVNRHELPELAPDWVNIDHRRAIAFAPGDMTAYVHATWDDGPDGKAHIETVHRLSNLGAVVTQAGHDISPEGFEAEWRMLNLMTVEGGRFSRIELFDESDLDAALARFDELNRPAP
jgi:hypothetical protein